MSSYLITLGNLPDLYQLHVNQTKSDNVTLSTEVFMYKYLVSYIYKRGRLLPHKGMLFSYSKAHIATIIL